MLLKLNLKAYMHWEGQCIHAFYMIFCVWQKKCTNTPCTIKSNTFNHRMLKPKGKDKIREVTGTGRTINWQSAHTLNLLYLNVKLLYSTSCLLKYVWHQVEENLHYLLHCGASRRAECRTRSPRSRPGPKKPAWHSSQAEQGDVCSPSGTYYS